MKILGVTTTYNVVEKIPYVMPYYERMEIDKLIIYDNYSTDNTVELLSKYPFVEIRYYETDSFDDNVILNIKNTAWREYQKDYDWAIVCDFDEVLFSEKNFKDVLSKKRLEGKTYFKKTGFNLLSRKFPPVNDKLIHENVKHGYIWDCDDNILGIWGNKTLLFDMKNIEVEYTEKGAHSCVFKNGNASPFDDDINFFHIKMIDFNYILNQSIAYHKRIKKHNITCYDFFIKNLSKIYEQSEAKAIPVEKYISTPGEKIAPAQLILIARADTLNDGKKIINELNSHIDRNVFYQIGLIIYNGSNTDYDYDILHHYSFNNNIIPYICGKLDGWNMKDVLEGYAYKFRHNHKIPNPWISFYSEDIIHYIGNPELKKTLEDAMLIGKDILDYNGLHFERYETFVRSTKPTLGAYLIVKNEEHNIKKCITNLQSVCDEIVVVDTGSNDSTLEILSNINGVQIEHFKWVNDFSAARNYAMSKMKSDYIFSIDADELLNDNLINTINSLKNNDFYGYSSINMYIQLDGDRFYLGGRQIVKNTEENIWKYKIHEKLYYNESNGITINANEGYIIHEPHNSKANYNKYAEIYYKELNSGNAFNTDNFAHYFYYLFFTLNDVDYFTSRRYLYNIFNTDKIKSITENQGFNLYDVNWITQEEFIINSLIGGYKNPNMVIKYYPKLTSDIAKYICLKWCYDNGMKLTETQYVDLAYISYNYGLFKDFINLTKELITIYPDSEIGNHNISFIENTLHNLDNYNLIIDCSEGDNCWASTIYLMSQYYDKVYFKINDIRDLPSDFCCNELEVVQIIYDEDEIENEKKNLNISGNHQHNRIILKDIMQKLAYGYEPNSDLIYIN